MFWFSTMTIFEILLLALSLSFDTFAVSLCSGIAISNIERKRFIFVVMVFAIVQTAFTFFGWLLGESVASYINSIDHWVSFALLVYVGGKMIWDNVKRKEDGVSESSIDIRNNKTLFTVSVATSIDAFAVGISLAMLSMSPFRICFLFAAIAFITAIAAVVGLKGGRKIGVGIGCRASLIGGGMLIIIGLKILIEHLGLL